MTHIFHLDDAGGFVREGEHVVNLALHSFPLRQRHALEELGAVVVGALRIGPMVLSRRLGEDRFALFLARLKRKIPADRSRSQLRNRAVEITDPAPIIHRPKRKRRYAVSRGESLEKRRHPIVKFQRSLRCSAGPLISIPALCTIIAGLPATSRHRPVAFASEGSPRKRRPCMNNPG